MGCRLSLGGALIVALVVMGGVAHADAVDLNTWTAESYDAVSGFGAGVWTVSPDGKQVTQSVNGQPTLFYSDFLAHGTNTTGKILVTGGDDDFIGFVLGFDPGDASSAAADYLLVDWKGGTQSHNFGGGPASYTPGGTALAGLAVSRVEGIPTADEFWQHADLIPSSPGVESGGLTELARGTTLGATGWSVGTTYEFEFLFSAAALEVWVDGVKEMDVAGSFENGRLGFYNFSQAGVNYSAFEVVAIPEPASIALVGLGALGLGVWRRRRS